MISCNHTYLIGLFNVIRNFGVNKAFPFFAAFLLVIITGCASQNPVQPTIEEEYKAQKKLVQLQSSVDDGDYLNARFVLDSLQKDFSHTKIYKEHSKRINELAGQIKKETKNIIVEDKIEYLFVPPRLETKLWKEYMSRAERIVSQSQGRIGIAVLCISYEDGDIEPPSVRADFGPNNELSIFYNGGGYSSMSTFKSGDAVFIGSGFWRYRASDSNDKDVSAIGNIIIGGIYHYPVKLKIEVQKGKAVAFGEIIVRAIPKKYCGNLKVKVETEEGLKLTDAGVALKVAGFYPGITKPIKEGSCLFSSIGPGEYTVEIAPNNILGSAARSAVVTTGQTTEITITAYRHRILELDWRFRESKEPNNWLSGQKTIKTKEYWQPDDEWIDVHYPVLEFSDWTGNTCNIKRYNGELMHLDTNEPFDKMDFPLNFSAFSRDYPVKEGDIFAWQERRGEQKEGLRQALIRIRKITPVGIPDAPKSSAPKE